MERSRAVGMTMAGFHLGSVAGLIISPTLLATRFGVKAPFVAFGLAGFAWLAVWLVAIAANPHSQSRISREELQYIKRGSEDPSTVGMELNSSASSRRSAVPPFRLLLSKLPTWAIIVANFMNNWVHIELYLVLVA
jgi:ACS family sodium-dependent inorganic phosphate cotransporter